MSKDAIWSHIWDLAIFTWVSYSLDGSNIAIGILWDPNWTRIVSLGRKPMKHSSQRENSINQYQKSNIAQLDSVFRLSLKCISCRMRPVLHLKRLTDFGRSIKPSVIKTKIKQGVTSACQSETYECDVSQVIRITRQKIWNAATAHPHSLRASRLRVKQPPSGPHRQTQPLIKIGQNFSRRENHHSR